MEDCNRDDESKEEDEVGPKGDHVNFILGVTLGRENGMSRIPLKMDSCS